MDHHATTPTDPRVVESMLPFFSIHFGNPASKTHSFGESASLAVEAARSQVANIIGAQPKEITFTSGATESNNLALQGLARSMRGKKNHILTLKTEHKSVLDCCDFLQRNDVEVTFLDVKNDGLVELNQLEAAIQPNTFLVSIMLANNEIGVIQPLNEVAKICESKGILFHSDITQAVGKIPVDVTTLGLNLASFTAHKLYGPKGVGALYINRSSPRKVRLEPLIYGGGHEKGLRSGTLPSPLIVGFGKACELAQQLQPTEAVRLLQLRTTLWKGLQETVPGVLLNGSESERLPGNLNISIPGVQGEALLLALKDVALSSGSACTSTDSEPSHVLLALGRSHDLADASLRFGLGRGNTQEDVDWLLDNLPKKVAELKEFNPVGVPR